MFAASLGLLFLVTLTGCVQEVPVEKDYYISVSGKWVDSYKSTYEIKTGTFKNYGEGYSSYEGDSLMILPLSENSGTIFIKYTVSANPDFTYSSTAPDVGKWYAISYKNLTKNSISISGAWKNGGKTSTTTLEEAVKEFTIENGYFKTYSECTKK